ncbi:MAG: immune inhibitor A, partial [Bifidobacteriaceae bacterium]|nr:immune inhibitor A [Bifidobacteriaceae bacterium]
MNAHTPRRQWRVGRLAVAVLAASALAAPLLSAPVAASPDPFDSSVLEPVDPQNPKRMDDMTWDDYTPLPNKPEFQWNTKTTGTMRAFKGAIVLVRFKDRDFVVTNPIDDTKPLTNPSSKLSAPVPAADTPTFYNNLLNDATGLTEGGRLNQGRTLNEYWMEQSGGRISVEMDVFGPYTLPGDYAQYGLNDSFQMQAPQTIPDPDNPGQTIRRPLVDGSTPTGNTNAEFCPQKYYLDPQYRLPVWNTTSRAVEYTRSGCAGNIRDDTKRLWAQDPKVKQLVAQKFPALGADAKIDPLALFDQVFYLTAGQDESSTWEEFGQMQWTQATVPDAYGPPREYDDGSGNLVAKNGYGDIVTTNWAKTRYI